MVKAETWENKKSKELIRVVHFSFPVETDDGDKLLNVLDNGFKVSFSNNSVAIEKFGFESIFNSDFYIISENGSFKFKPSQLMIKDFVEVGDVAAEEKSHSFKFDVSKLSYTDNELEGMLKKLEDLVALYKSFDIKPDSIFEQIKLRNQIEDVLYGEIDETFRNGLVVEVRNQMPKDIPLLSSDDKDEQTIFDAICEFDWPKLNGITPIEAYTWFMDMNKRCKAKEQYFYEEGGLLEHDIKIYDSKKIKLLYHYYSSGSIAYIMLVSKETCVSPY